MSSSIASRISRLRPTDPPARPEAKGPLAGTGRGEEGNGGVGRLAATLVVALLLASLASCGIESTTAYYQPSFTNNSGVLKLQHNSANIGESGFLGYEIYYRAYEDTTAGKAKATSDYNVVASTVQDQTVYTPLSALSKLKSLGFVRLYIYDADSPEAHKQTTYIRISGSSASTYSIYPNGTSRNWFMINSLDSSTHVSLYRNVAGTNNSVRISFNSTYTAASTSDTQPEYYSPAAISSGKNQDIHIVFFAVAYGFNFSSSTSSGDIYSYPAVCSVGNTDGYMTYSLPDALYENKEEL